MNSKQSKLLGICLLVTLMFSALSMSAQTVTKTFSNESLRNVLKEVERQTKMSVIYKVDEVNASQKVTATFHATPVRDVLTKVLGSHLGFKIDHKMITIFKREAKPAAKDPQAPKKTVKGQVLDENGEPVIGATVRSKATGAAVVTDLDGNFTISAEEGSKIEVSYLGYQPKSVTAKGDNLTVNIAQDEKTLNEVVVTALGIKKESKALTYNVQQLKNSDITGVKDANFMNALAGKVAGVEINASAAGIGGGVKVVMRGNKSINGNNNALYVIDGIPMPSLQANQPTDAYHGDAQTEQKLERIITQKYLAIFPDGQEAWSEYRRTGYPKLFTVDHNASNGAVNTNLQIRRLRFPASEYSNNNANVQAAVGLLGGPDNGGTKLWWDKNPKH